MLNANELKERAKKGLLHCSECRKFTPHNMSRLKDGQWSDCNVCHKTQTRMVGR